MNTTPINQQSSLLNSSECEDIPVYTNRNDDRILEHICPTENENDNINSDHGEETLMMVWKHDGCNKRYILFSAMLLCSIFFSARVLEQRATRRNPQILSSSKPAKKTASFPDDFIWGTGTSAYQIEGATHEDGRAPSIWDTYCTEAGVILDNSTGDVACDHYHRVKEDVLLMKELGLKTYRFSIAWTRIVPHGSAGSAVNTAGIDFYNHLLDTLIDHGIEPWVTLHHWDVPQTLYDSYGGWMDDQIINDFTFYAHICFDAFGDRVKHWVTINEPWTIAVNGYASGIHAPGRYQRPDVEPYIVGHHLLLAHANAVKLYRNKFASSQKGVIGISNSGDFRYPKDEHSEDDQLAAERSMEFQLGWFSDPIWKGDYPSSMRQQLGERLPQFTAEQKMDLLSSADFLGLNHYSSLLVSEPKEPKTFGGYWGSDMSIDIHDNPLWGQNCMGWNIVPDGMKDILHWINERYEQQNITIYITENGSCENEPDVETARRDIRRQQYLELYIQAVSQAIGLGVNVKGYFAWSLMDNFEWQFGYLRRFGLYYVDFETLERIPKQSALWYRETMLLNGANIGKPK
uniref:beta-glucosidase n=1 Tax=Helicotheca tamesis TaxID=374047 RepID=A0A7S2I167_9STRA|mmetsp:Transcript_4306/g.5898  ORF Transcript_4306/g.5898 Transcript_4306/m.5898 type:complete len:574 (+) Transcript_4306:102-1823(+)